MCIPFCKKQNSETWKKKIFKSSHKNSTGVRSEVISEQTSNLPFLYAPDKDNRKVNFLLSAWGEKNHGWNCGGRKVGPKNTSWFELSKLHKGCVWKSEKRTRVWYGEAFTGERRGSNPFSPKRERRGRPCWVASAIFGRTRTKKAG